MRFLRSTLIGSTSAWLPSRKSTLHQIGAVSMTRDGHWRSASAIGVYERYFWTGMTVMTNPASLAAALFGAQSRVLANFSIEVKRKRASRRFRAPGG